MPEKYNIVRMPKCPQCRWKRKQKSKMYPLYWRKNNNPVIIGYYCPKCKGYKIKNGYHEIYEHIYAGLRRVI